MNYEQKYNKALDRARDLLSQCINDRDRLTKVYRVEDIESIFPELIESEDERIRKVLVGFFKNYKEQGTIGAETFNGIPTENILSWLEKQGEQILANSAKTCKDEQKTTDKCEGCNNVKGCVACVDGNAWAHIDEKNSVAWSEEDEKVVANLVDYFKVDDALQYTEKQVVEWLKALKNRIQSHKQWRPSDEQMEALEEITNSCYLVGSKYKPYMNSLYQESKKLREE